MSLFALIVAILLEQFYPFPPQKYPSKWIVNYVHFFQYYLNAGKHKHGRIAWFMAVLPLIASVILISIVLHRIHPVLSLGFNILVLYSTLRFRHARDCFILIHQALLTDRLADARQLLTIWRCQPSDEFSNQDVARVCIEEGLLAFHRNVMGSVVWFVIFSILGLSGGAGALLYWFSQFLYRHWAEENRIEFGAFGVFSRQAFRVLEWLPIRVTALIFAVVGNFEDTIFCWRTQASNWPDKEAGILLASGAGSLGVRLGMPIQQNGLQWDRAELGVGDDADVEFMQSANGLVWRSMVFVMIVLLMMTIVNLLN